MFNHPVEWKIGLRYLRPRRRYGFISIISFITMLTIALGVAALIIVLSVMNGFQKEIRERLLSTTSHIEVSEYQTSHWPHTIKRLTNFEHVVAAAPFVNAPGLLSYNGELRNIMIRGIDPMLEKQVVDKDWKITKGNLNYLMPNRYGIVLGESLALSLGLGVGSSVMVIVPQGNITPIGILPRFKVFTVVALFSTKIPEYDKLLSAIHLRDAQILFRMKNEISGIRLRLDDPLLAPEIKANLLVSNIFSTGAHATDWTDANSNYFHAVQIEKRMMLIILSTIILVAAFGLVSTLYMMVNDKRADIAILRTLGASPGSIMRIFIIQGMATGIFGTLLGLVLGIFATLHIGIIERFIERLSGAKILESQIYFVDYLPSKILLSDVSIIFLLTLTLTFLATLYPSLSAAKTQPSEALRYE